MDKDYRAFKANKTQSALLAAKSEGGENRSLQVVCAVEMPLRIQRAHATFTRTNVLMTIQPAHGPA